MVPPPPLFHCCAASFATLALFSSAVSFTPVSSCFRSQPLSEKFRISEKYSEISDKNSIVQFPIFPNFFIFLEIRSDFKNPKKNRNPINTSKKNRKYSEMLNSPIHPIYRPCSYLSLFLSIFYPLEFFMFSENRCSSDWNYLMQLIKASLYQ